MYKFSALVVVIVLMFSCGNPEQTNTAASPQKTNTSLYLNHHDSAKYVGINTCQLCHQDIYNSFIKTGMGKSFDVASRKKSSADFTHSIVYDRFSDFYYRAFWKGDSLSMMEYRLDGKDTVFKRIETVNYIIGSGQHTNSHIQSVNGYFNQMPMTFYTQKKTWDLPPGFENGMNSHFNRKIGLECMSCHNSYPDFVLGSENKFNSVPEGINCERCHGPGSIHVAQRSSGSKIDTSKYIDYSIVNPAKLSIDAQFDICQRCHLQGNAVLKENHSFYDFKPGMKLSDYMTVFLPKYKHADDEFIMASHADRLKQSACFVKSAEKIKNKSSLKPYQEAMTCVTCHNPHVSVKETNKEVFNQACNNCHHPGGKSDLLCTDQQVVAAKNAKPGHAPLSLSNCVGCHMPSSGSIDIPHVTVHDHYIRKPVSAKEKEKIKTFIGLYAINEKQPSAELQAKAYLNQFEKFDSNPVYLDSAAFFIQKAKKSQVNVLASEIKLYFIKKDYSQILTLLTQYGEDKLYAEFIHIRYDNAEAWTAYQIAEAYSASGKLPSAIKWFSKASALAPFYQEFKNKLATAYASSHQYQKAEELYVEILKEYPKHVSALTNLGYLKWMTGDMKSSEQLYQKALSLDPDYEPLLMNVVGLYVSRHDDANTIKYLKQILKVNPDNEKAKSFLKSYLSAKR